jgi:hypothetical protein
MGDVSSGWWETHSGWKFAALAAASLKLKKVLTVALGPRLRAFLNFVSLRTNQQIFATKAISHHPPSNVSPEPLSDPPRILPLLNLVVFELVT